jgi:hypothetical protein
MVDAVARVEHVFDLLADKVFPPVDAVRVDMVQRAVPGASGDLAGCSSGVAWQRRSLALAPFTDRWGSSPSRQQAGMITVPSAKVNSCRWLWSQRANASSIALPSCSNVAVRAAIGTRPGLGHKSPVCAPCTSSTVIAR